MKSCKVVVRPLPVILLYILLSLARMNAANAQCPASSPLVINSVTTTESRCQASGTATVSASGGSTPYTFNIIAGPTTAPAQSSNVLQSLTPGTYTVQVTDNCNTSVTSSVTVSGTYTIPTPTYTTQPTSCPGSSDGSITVTVSNGRSPLTYSLISPSPVTAGPQASNVFTGLPAGTYTCQVADSCGNFQTRTVTLPAGNSGAVSQVYSLRYLACDSFAYSIFINVTNAANYKPPFTTSITLPDGRVMTHVLTSPAVSFGYITDTYNFRYHHQAGAGDALTATVTNNCGASSSLPLPLSALLDMQVSFVPPTGCNASYTYTFDNGNDNSTTPSQVHCGTLTYTLVSPSGVVLATQTNNSTFTGYPPGNGYKVVRQDCCEKDSLVFDWAAPATTLQIAGYELLPYGTCKDGTTDLWVYLNFINTTGYVVVASGPSSVTFADGTVHNYIYPDTLKNQSLSIGGLNLTDLTSGTYKIVVVDDCGHRDSTMVTVKPSNLRHDAFTATVVKGCPNANLILLNATSTASAGSTFATITANSSTVATVSSSPYTGSMTGLPSGNWYVSYSYQNPYSGIVEFLHGMDTYGCDVIRDTLVIPAYTQPVFAASPVVANCGSVRDVALLPDSSNGVQPYQYQIISGPTTTSAQSSPVFPGLSAGTYTFQMTDACANSYSRNITIDTLAVPNVSTSGGTCAGGAAVFTLPASPFYNYTWRHPDGSTSTGDTLAFNPITAADTGTYNVTVTSTIGGCTSTSSKSVTLGFCTVLEETLLHFSGEWRNANLQLSWQTADEASIGYYVVERSANGGVFTPLQQVEASGVASNAYTVTDTQVPSGIVNYRLQMVGKDGAISYSKTLSFNNVNKQSLNVYPRMITGNTPVRVTYPSTSGTSLIRVVGIDGKVWWAGSIPAGSTQTSIDVTPLARGSYFVVFAGNGSLVATQVWKD